MTSRILILLLLSFLSVQGQEKKELYDIINEVSSDRLEKDIKTLKFWHAPHLE